MQWSDKRLWAALVIAFVCVLTIGYTIERAGYWPRSLTRDSGVDCPPFPEATEARTYSSQGKFKKAVESYTEAVRLSPKMYTAFQWRAKAYRELHMDVEAANDDETAKTLEKQFWDLVARTGVKRPKQK